MNRKLRRCRRFGKKASRLCVWRCLHLVSLRLFVILQRQRSLQFQYAVFAGRLNHVRHATSALALLLECLVIVWHYIPTGRNRNQRGGGLRRIGTPENTTGHRSHSSENPGVGGRPLPGAISPEEPGVGERLPVGPMRDPVVPAFPGRCSWDMTIACPIHQPNGRNRIPARTARTEKSADRRPQRS
jgi:hypothetical protein